jgi:hypothetical protein
MYTSKRYEKNQNVELGSGEPAPGVNTNFATPERGEGQLFDEGDLNKDVSACSV